MITDVTTDPAYRALAEQTLETALAKVGVEVADVQFGEPDPQAARSWLCMVVDPATENHATAETHSSAVEHLKRIDPGGILGEPRIHATVVAVEVSDDASLETDDGVRSPWQDGLAAARVRFQYQPV